MDLNNFPLFLEQDEQLLQRLFILIYNFCQKKLTGTDSTTLQTLASDTIMGAYKTIGNRPDFELKVKLTTYLQTIAKYKCIDHIRSKKQKYQITELEQLDLSTDNSIENRIISEEKNQDLWQAIQYLSDTERFILINSVVEGMSAKVLGLALNKKPATIRKSKQRILEKLKAILLPIQ